MEVSTTGRFSDIWTGAPGSRYVYSVADDSEPETITRSRDYTLDTYAVAPC